MITLNGTTYTDAKETMEYHAKFFNKHGEGVAEPCCHYCGKTTCYLVEEAEVEQQDGKVTRLEPKRNGVKMLMNFMKMSFFVDGEQIFFPSKACLDCDARDHARVNGSNIKANPGKSLTAEESVKWRRVHAAKLGDINAEKNKGQEK